MFNLQENPVEEIEKIASHLPTPVLEDITKRMSDWKAGGGHDTDPYMHQQLRYARNIMKISPPTN